MITMITERGLISLFGFLGRKAKERNLLLSLTPLNSIPDQTKTDQAFTAQNEKPGLALVTAEELMRELGISKSTLHRRQKAGLPFIKNGNKRYYEVPKVQDWMKRYQYYSL